VCWVSRGGRRRTFSSEWGRGRLGLACRGAGRGFVVARFEVSAGQGGVERQAICPLPKLFSPVTGCHRHEAREAALQAAAGSAGFEIKSTAPCLQANRTQFIHYPLMRCAGYHLLAPMQRATQQALLRPSTIPPHARARVYTVSQVTGFGETAMRYHVLL
jgi:hypothetical protein